MFDGAKLLPFRLPAKFSALKFVNRLIFSEKAAQAPRWVCLGRQRKKIGLCVQYDCPSTLAGLARDFHIHHAVAVAVAFGFHFDGIVEVGDIVIVADGDLEGVSGHTYTLQRLEQHRASLRLVAEECLLPCYELAKLSRIYRQFLFLQAMSPHRYC